MNKINFQHVKNFAIFGFAFRVSNGIIGVISAKPYRELIDTNI